MARFLQLLPFLLLATPAAAGPRPITLADALAAADVAPSAQIATHELHAAEAEVDAAAAWPVFPIHVDTNYLTARFVAGLTIPLPVFGTIGAAQKLARAQAEVARADVRVDRADRHRHVAQLWVALARADDEISATAAAATHAAELELIAKGRLDAGAGADVDVSIAHAARVRADVVAATADQEASAASAELAAALAWDVSVQLRSDGVPGGDGSNADELALLRGKLSSHPRRIAAMQRIAAADATINQAEVARYPTFALESQVSLDDPTNNCMVTMGSSGPPGCGYTDVMVGVALELPLFSHLGDKVRAAQATRAAEAARLAATEAELGGALEAAFVRWQAATAALRALRDVVLPAQERAAKLSAQAYREGARDLATAVQAERDLLAVQRDVNSAQADAATAWVELETAAGL
jgi:outer membrane protein TolC